MSAVFRSPELLTSAVLRLPDTLMRFALMAPEVAVTVLLSLLETLRRAVLRSPELLTSGGIEVTGHADEIRIHGAGRCGHGAVERA